MQIFDPSLTLVSVFATGCLLLYGARRYPRSVAATLVAFAMILCGAIIDIVAGAVTASQVSPGLWQRVGRAGGLLASIGMQGAALHVHSMQLPAAREGAAACEEAASTCTPVLPMSRETLAPLVLAALFTLGSVSIHAARRHPDAVTLALLLLLGFWAAVYVGQHTRLNARHLNGQHKAFDPRQPLPEHPMM